MRLYFLGTGSGTEPIPGYRHVSFAVEWAGGVYWFDAGEGCAYAAHTSGVDLRAVRAVFISHTHTDHIGGLANLIWTIRKLGRVDPASARKLADNTLQLFIPDLDVWEGVRAVVGGPVKDLSLGFNLRAERYEDGTIFDDGDLKVTALHNLHLGVPEDGQPWQSFSLRIEAGGKTIVFSGDTATVSEIGPLLDTTDLFLMETGHHKVEDICMYLASSGKSFGRLAFIHHGRAILADPEGEAQKAGRILGKEVLITRDGMTLDV
ncbi:MAG: hypothetical protein CL878_08755 [Dehalococcoidia bacterium]|nr:hypothetical protein [Dehalococcoidia bacterium]